MNWFSEMTMWQWVFFLAKVILTIVLFYFIVIKGILKDIRQRKIESQGLPVLETNTPNLEAIISEAYFDLFNATKKSSKKVRVWRQENMISASIPDESAFTHGDILGRGYPILQLKFFEDRVNLWKSYSVDNTYPLEMLPQVIAQEADLLASM